jgi:hypothetical protein
MNTQQLLRHWRSKRSLSSRDKVIRIMWPVLHEQAQLFINNINIEKSFSEDQVLDNSKDREQEDLVLSFLHHYLQEQTPSELVDELIAPFDSTFSPFEWRLIVMKRFFITRVLSS